VDGRGRVGVERHATAKRLIRELCVDAEAARFVLARVPLLIETVVAGACFLRSCGRCGLIWVQAACVCTEWVESWLSCDAVRSLLFGFDELQECRDVYFMKYK
jgi:hypothetical protein